MFCYAVLRIYSIYIEVKNPSVNAPTYIIMYVCAFTLGLNTHQCDAQRQTHSPNRRT